MFCKLKSDKHLIRIEESNATSGIFQSSRRVNNTTTLNHLPTTSIQQQQKRACSVPHAKNTTNSIILTNNSTDPSFSSTTTTPTKQATTTTTTATTAVAAPITPNSSERKFSKLKILKQKSLMYEIFARSSSASFERQASYDSGTTCIHGYPHTPNSNTNTSQNNYQSPVSSKTSHKLINNNSSNSKNHSNLKTLNFSNIIVPSNSSLNSSIISNGGPIYNNYMSMIMNPVNKRLITAFKAPCLFSLVLNNDKIGGSGGGDGGMTKISKVATASLVVNPLINICGFGTNVAANNNNNNNGMMCSLSCVSSILRSGRSAGCSGIYIILIVLF